MTGVVDGFATIITVIAVGYLLAHLGLFDLKAQQMLAKLAFFVASPALMITVLADTDVSEVLSANLVASAASVVVVVAVFVPIAMVVFRQQLAETVIGALCVSYVNAGNLGLPIAAYVLGDAAYIAPTLLFQMLVLQPLALTMLDLAVADRRVSVPQLLSRPFRTPLTVSSMIGLALSVTGTTLPTPVRDPLELLGGMAVPAMLIGYGISLKVGPRPGAAGSVPLMTTVIVLKMVVQPLAAWAVAHYVFDLAGPQLLAVTVIAALPTAQNIFVHATRYGRGTLLARDAIFISTILSVPIIALIAALLG